MHTNSLESYREIFPTLSNRRAVVLRTIGSLGKASCHDVAEKLGVYPNVVSGRFTELKNEDLIKSAGRKDKKELYEINYDAIAQKVEEIKCIN